MTTPSNGLKLHDAGRMHSEDCSTYEVCVQQCALGGPHLRPVRAVTGLAQGLSLEGRQPSEPLPQRAGSGQIEGGEAGAGGDVPPGAVQEAARQALAMADRHRMQAVGEQPQLDGEAPQHPDKGHTSHT